MRGFKSVPKRIGAISWYAKTLKVLIEVVERA